MSEDIPLIAVRWGPGYLNVRVDEELIEELIEELVRSIRIGWRGA